MAMAFSQGAVTDTASEALSITKIVSGVVCLCRSAAVSEDQQTILGFLVALLGFLELVELGPLHAVIQGLRLGGEDFRLDVLEPRGRERPLALDALAGGFQRLVDVPLLGSRWRVLSAMILGCFLVMSTENRSICTLSSAIWARAWRYSNWVLSRSSAIWVVGESWPPPALFAPLALPVLSPRGARTAVVDALFGSHQLEPVEVGLEHVALLAQGVEVVASLVLRCVEHARVALEPG